MWGMVGQLRGGGGGRGRASVFDHQPVPHLLDGRLVCDYRDQLEEQTARERSGYLGHLVTRGKMKKLVQQA